MDNKDKPVSVSESLGLIEAKVTTDVTKATFVSTPVKTLGLAMLLVVDVLRDFDRRFRRLEVTMSRLEGPR